MPLAKIFGGEADGMAGGKFTLRGEDGTMIGVVCGQLCGFDQFLPVSLAEPRHIGGRAPFPDKIGPVGVFFGLAGIERGDLLFLCRCGFAGLAALGEPGLDLRCALAEGADDVGRHALDLEQRVLAGHNIVTQRADAHRQLLPVDRTDGLLELIEGAGLKAPPVAVAVAGHVHDDIVGVELRVLRAAGVVPETGNNEVAGLVALDRAIFPDPGGSGMTLGEGQCHLNRPVMRTDQAAVARHLGHDRHRLWGTHGHVPSGAMLKLAVAGGAELLAIGQLAVEHVAEGVAFDFAGKAQFLRTFALPFAG